VNNEPLDPERMYRVVLTRFEANGGDGCEGFTHHKDVTPEGIPEQSTMLKIVSWFLERQPNKSYAPPLYGRCLVVKS